MDVVAAASRCPLMGMSASFVFGSFLLCILVFVYPSC